MKKRIGCAIEMEIISGGRERSYRGRESVSIGWNHVEQKRLRIRTKDLI